MKTILIYLKLPISSAYLFEDFVRNFYNQEQGEFKVKREDIKWDAIALGNSNLSLLPKMQTDIILISSNRKIVMDTKFYKQTLSFNFSENNSLFF